MAHILIAYSTVDGHTRGICQRLQRSMQSMGDVVTLVTVAQAGTADLSDFDKIVIGASVRYGRHRADVHDFVHRHRAALAHKPSAFFSVNIVARKPYKGQPETNPYLQRFLQDVRWRPKELDVFAGKLDYPRYGFVDRQMIRLIMWLTEGPTDPTTVVEFTDWCRVDAFAQRVYAM